MDRLTYISTHGKGITLRDIEEIGVKSEENNARDGLTGVLISFKGVFYQIIEGNPTELYRCFSRIQADPRHSEIFVLNLEKGIKERQYGQWKMKSVVLDKNTDPLIAPIRGLLDALTGTHQILQKYTPQEVLQGIQRGQNPLTWGFKRDEMVVMFSDLISFSTMTERIGLKEMENLLETYFVIASRAIDDSGGQISKLIGDGFMAYYPANDAIMALGAAVRIIKDLKNVREKANSQFLKLSYCGIGLSAGWVLKGNIGSWSRKDYTLLGDVVNSASRLERHTREVGHSILFDHRFLHYLGSDSNFSSVRMGELTPKGKSEKLWIYSVKDPDIRFDRSPEQIAQEIGKIGD